MAEMYVPVRCPNCSNVRVAPCIWCGQESFYQPAPGPLDVERLRAAWQRHLADPTHGYLGGDDCELRACEPDEYSDCPSEIAAAYAALRDREAKPDPLVTYTDPAGGPDWEPRRDEA